MYSTVLTGLLAALAAALAWGASDFLAALAGRTARVIVVLIAAQAVGLGALVLVALAAGRSVQTGWTPALLVWGSAGGVTETLGFVALYQAMKIGKIGVVCPIAALGVVVPLGLDLGLGRIPGLLPLLGVAVAVLGILTLAGGEDTGPATARDWPAIRLAMLSAGSFGVSMTCLAQSAAQDEFASGLVLRLSSLTCLTTVFVLTAVRARRRVTASSVPPPAATDLPLALPQLSSATFRGRHPVALWWVSVSVCGIADCCGNYAYALAATRAPLSLVSAVGSLYPVVTMVLARMLLAERLGRRQQAGAAAAIGGMVLMSLP